MSFPIFQPPKPAQVKRARAMRRTLTEPEKKLWRALRQRMPAHHFRRQLPIGPYIVDFCCLASRLVIEVDGNQHGFDRQQAYDARRTTILTSHGFRVLRFANHDIHLALDSVLDTILAASR